MSSTLRTAAILEEFRHLDPDVMVDQILVFLTVMEKPGLTVTEVSDATRIQMSSVARNIASLTRTHRNGQPGLDILTASEDTDDSKVKHITFTPKGKKLAEALFKLMS